MGTFLKNLLPPPEKSVGGEKTKIVFKLSGSDAISQLDEFIEKRVLPLKEKYPYTEISIEVLH